MPFEDSTMVQATPWNITQQQQRNELYIAQFGWIMLSEKKKKPGLEDHILCHSILITLLKLQKNADGKHINGCKGLSIW